MSGILMRHPRLALALLLVGCAGCRQDMFNQPKYKPLQKSVFFADGRASRPLPEDTVPFGGGPSNELLRTGKLGGAPANGFPFPVTAGVLDRGQQRYEIFCSMCHGAAGDGDGMVVQRGFQRPPSFHTDRLRQAPTGHLFDVISNGSGAMYDYKSRLSVEDRWAIVAYVRVLQQSQNTPASEIAPSERAKLEAER